MIRVVERFRFTHGLTNIACDECQRDDNADDKGPPPCAGEVHTDFPSPAGAVPNQENATKTARGRLMRVRHDRELADGTRIAFHSNF